jgi:hypothetical protein
MKGYQAEIIKKHKIPGGLVMLPVLLLMVGQVSGVMYCSLGVVLAVGFVTWLLIVVLIMLASKSFHRSEKMLKI